MTIDTSLDLITLGRCGVDLYSQQIGARLEDATSFAKYLGGSSTNIAACGARQGLRTGLITRVGDEHAGRFLREQLEREGVDTRAVITDPERPTAMVMLGIKDSDTFPLVFVRENCADMAISEADLDADYIASAKCLLVTGTHFSTPAVHATSTAALNIARARGVRTAIDIDYRPVLWGLASRGDGETRFVSSDEVSAHLQAILPLFDLVIGTEEEIHIAGGSDDTLQALRSVREHTQAIVVLKRGPFGATVFDGAIPASIDDGVTVEGVTVDVRNVLGAGDAFAAGFLRGW
jgi:5-dehydro-2-deoxygluconokinase